MAAGHVIVTVVVALLVGGVLNAQALTDTAARQPFGWKRTAAVVGATPFRGVAGLLGLDRPHTVLAGAADDLTGGPRTVGAQPAPAADAPVDVAASRPPPSEPGEPPTEAPTQAAATRGRPTRKDPLRVWVGGDSLTSEFGPALSDRLARTNRSEAEVEFRFSSGLSRPDFFDWPARLDAITRQQDPDAFVVMFGANDGQNIAVRGDVLEFGTGAWKAEYARRVGAVMDNLAVDGRHVYWIGQPLMRSADFDAKMKLLNGIYRAQASGRESVTYIDTRELFSDSNGAFAPYLEDSSGDPVLMRQQDGVHFTRAGGERLAAVVIDALDSDWSLTES